MKLLEASEADHFMFADQDDVWLRGKIIIVGIRSSEMAAAMRSRHAAFRYLRISRFAIPNLKVVEQSFWEVSTP